MAITSQHNNNVGFQRLLYTTFPHPGSKSL